jgi:hypothetical protein
MNIQRNYKQIKGTGGQKQYCIETFQQNRDISICHDWAKE